MPSRHSGSSHSSGSSFRSSSSSSRSSFSSSSWSRPSSHSGSSHSSLSGSYNSNRNSRHLSERTTINNYYSGPRVIVRPRMYQPIGYYNPWGLTSWFRPRPTIYYCVNHNYTYYPESWTSGGTTYKSGYYDENGKHYDEKPFIEKQPNRIYTKCPNCGYVKDYDYMKFEELENCPKCGTRMNIINDDDDIFIRSESYDEETPIWEYILKVISYIVIGAFICLLPFMLLRSCSRIISTANEYTVTTQEQNNISQFNANSKVLYLRKSGSNYTIVNSSNDADKVLYKDADDNFFDEETGLYLYYAKEYDVWQYWYEPISSNFGDYGWMEHDSDGWWIEVDHDNWINVPSNYSTSELWYIK